MTPMTEITSNALGYLTGDDNATWDLSVLAGEFEDDYDLEGIERDYRAAVESILSKYRPDWTIAGDFIFGPAYVDDSLTEAELVAIGDDFDDIDTEAILAAHDRTA